MNHHAEKLVDPFKPQHAALVDPVLGGIIEEFLYRGYAFERLSLLLRSRIAAAVVVSLLFAYAHVPLWGFAVSTVLVVPGICATAFYAWRRDLAANVIAHVATDLLGIAFRGAG